MTDIFENIAPLKRAYLDALKTQGRDAADKEIQKYTNGARGQNAWRHVKEADVAKAIHGLEQLTLKGDGGVAKVSSRFASIAKRAYGRGEQPKAPRELDPVAIFDRWNNPPPVDRTK